MLDMLGFYAWPLLLAFAVGVAIGWWAWARRSAPLSGSKRGAVEATKSTAITPPVATKPITAKPTEGTTGTAKPKPNIVAAVGAPEDLTKIKGIGPKLNDMCHSLGVSRFDQISQWTHADILEVDQHLHGFVGRIERDNWVEQAGLLAKGDIAAFEAKFGKLAGEVKPKK